MQYDFYSLQSLPLSFMHWVTQVKSTPRFEPGSPDWEADDLPTELSLPPPPPQIQEFKWCVENMSNLYHWMPVAFTLPTLAKSMGVSPSNEVTGSSEQTRYYWYIAMSIMLLVMVEH